MNPFNLDNVSKEQLTDTVRLLNVFKDKYGNRYPITMDSVNNVLSTIDDIINTPIEPEY